MQIAIGTIALVVSAYPKKYQTQSSPTEILQIPSDYSPDSTVQPPHAPKTILELPREESPSVPFYSPEPSTELKAPTDYFIYPEQVFQIYPASPSEDLQPPSQVDWNPSNDPKLFFEIPIILNTPANVPTNTHPKKFNKNIEKKSKPYNLKPKTEIELIPISDKEFAQRQKSVDKLINQMSKQEYKKQNIEVDKVLKKTKTKTNDHEPAETTISDNFSSFPVSSLSSHSDKLVGFGGNSNGDRMQFQMHGHDGASSYKWGFDTGKG